MADRTIASIAPFLEDAPEATLDEWWENIDQSATRLAPWSAGATGGWQTSMLNSMIQRQVRLLTYIYVHASSTCLNFAFLSVT